MNTKISPIIIAPSILSANFAYLGAEIEKVVMSGADWIHIDVMDNIYVPNLTIGPMVCESIRNITEVPLDIHLMVESPDDIIPKFAKSGANIITVHPETTKHLDRTLSIIRDQGCKSGLAFNPSTPLNYLDYIMDKVDLILIMSVNPGFGGQEFIPSTIIKLKEASDKIKNWKEISGSYVSLQVDGGINANNIKQAHVAGANVFVAGSAIFNSKDYASIISLMRSNAMSDL
ncbi:ribulose-phosphate 3-epimerase [Candidatus Kinetoplastibacterium oncopeltii TCC290E]|uniref:Ribulose-phosphate 3-epimerase n=1 Tax=Candidatus Kinetoplastidibacterium stringomonadis TCC290E TaxID=1208920 RepID=M1L631_9PROT|nr:ribulose-phosphate 3-epimerase [Candidatus Kinetoplastibacterium oncopeltii]AGF48073.1 ribulose-phosphate 3-epimerase [Candidatus Kinetoplastibacterium oncopeltii TCC290E]